MGAPDCGNEPCAGRRPGAGGTVSGQRARAVGRGPHGFDAAGGGGDVARPLGRGAGAVPRDVAAGTGPAGYVVWAWVRAGAAGRSGGGRAGAAASGASAVSSAVRASAARHPVGGTRALARGDGGAGDRLGTKTQLARGGGAVAPCPRG